MLIVILHLVAQKLKLAKMHKVIPNRMFGRVLPNDLGWEARLSELSLPGLDLHGPRPSVSSG